MATRCSPTPRKPPTPITTALMFPVLSVNRSLIEPRLSLLSLSTLTPTTFDARQLPWNDESDAAAGATLARSVVAVGFCANATVASKADPTRPAVIYFASMWCLPVIELVGRKHADASGVPIAEHDLSVIRADGARIPCNIAAHTRARRPRATLLLRPPFNRGQKPPQYGGVP